MKSVLISIQPKWCELIASGKKTVEVRKTKPKLDTPFKVYIYATKSGDRLVLKSDKVFEISRAITGKVIGEFVCDKIDEYRYGVYEGEFCYHIPTIEGEKTCLEYPQAEEYGNGKPLYFWHISNLVIYDKPRELSEFMKECKLECDMRSLKYPPCEKCEHLIASFGCGRTIIRPPQSWCYVDGGDNNAE